MTVAEYRDLGRAVLPAWFFAVVREEEMEWAFAQIFQEVEVQIDFWYSQTFLEQAVGATGQPDWLNQHGKDRSTSRQENELDSDYQARLQRIVPTSVTFPNLLTEVQAAATGAGLGTVFGLELKYDQAYFVDRSAQTGTGGTFTAGTGSLFQFEPTAGFFSPLLTHGTVSEYRLIVSGALSSGNDGTFVISDIVNDSLEFTNASGVAGVDPTVTWTIAPYDSAGNRLDGFVTDYFDRGHRMGTLRPTVIFILPFPATEALRLSVAEAQRLLKAAGVQVLVERRQSP